MQEKEIGRLLYERFESIADTHGIDVDRWAFLDASERDVWIKLGEHVRLKVDMPDDTIAHVLEAGQAMRDSFFVTNTGHISHNRQSLHSASLYWDSAIAKLRAREGQ